eukprot:s702_g34.t1
MATSLRVGLTVLFALAFLGPSAGQENGLPNGTCFEDAVAAELRKNLTSMDGESVPVTFLLAGWSSAQVTSSVIEILVTEILGYIIAVEPRAPGSSVDSIYCMLGCATWWNATSRGCETRKVKHHMMIDSWYLGFTHVINSLAEIYMEEMPVNAGDMGYPGETGGYLPAAAVDEARNATGLALEYYRSWDASWFTPWNYFTDVATVNTSDLMRCSDSLLSDNSSAYYYFAKSGDAGGVDITTDGEGVKTYKFACQDDYFWLSSACRSDLTKCVPFITGGGGWDVLPTTQQAAAYNMPVALGVAATWSKFLEVPKKYKTMFYWWTPDNAFLEMKPSKLVFPPFNAYAWSQVDYTTAAAAVPVAKIAPKDLQAMAPDISKLLEASLFDLEAVDSMMLNMKSNSVTREQAACDWLKANTDRWKSWIPKATQCNPGFGLYDDATETFTAERATATTCRACLPGMFSKAFADDDGSTYICEACPAGQQQLGAGAMACDACPAGTAKAEQSTEECAPCAAGAYQDEKGALQCKMCPPGTTTMILGMKSISGCGCEAGSIDVSDLNSPDRLAANCIHCSEGLTCPMMSTVSALLAGRYDLDNLAPKVTSGYFSWVEDPTEVFKCPGTHCPGGRPGTCEARASLGECISIGGDMMVAFLQQLGVLSAISVPWPGTLKNIFDFSSLFVLNLQSLGFSCASSGGEQQYVLSASFFIAVVTTLPCLGYFTQFCSCMRHRGLNWDFYKTICVTGKFLQSGFTTMCNIGLVPFMCFLHPNGRRSILKYPHIFCGSSEHGMMQLFGILVLLLSLTHFILCCWASWKAPTWSVASPNRIRGMVFFIGNFRPSTWWFGLVLLSRGPLLSLPVVLAPNANGIQLALMLCVLQVSFAWQLWFLPWKAPILNLVDAISTALFLVLLAISLHLEAAVADSLSFLDSFGTGMYFVSLGIIACVSIFGLALLLWQRCCLNHMLIPSIMNLGQVRDPEEILESLLAVAGTLEGKDETEKEILLRKMSSSVSAYDLRLVGQALDILIADCIAQATPGAEPHVVVPWTDEMAVQAFNQLNNERRENQRRAFPLNANLSALIFVSLADLTQDQRNTLTSIMTHRGRTLDQYNVQELRDLFLEMFCTTKTAVDNPMIQPSASGQRRSFLVLEGGDLDGTDGYWAEDEDDGAEGFLDALEDV